MLKFPVIGLSPVDGVTDVVFRQLVDKSSKPDVMYTEFVPIDGLLFGSPVVYNMLLRHRTSTPIFAQLFGHDPESFYKCALIALEIGFDGIDINMGCPDRNVVKRGCGADLILNPEQAQKIILSVKKSVSDWVNGKTYKDIDLNDLALSSITGLLKTQKYIKKTVVPVTLKTRIGYYKPTIKSWLEKLLEAEPDIISLHGRTFEQKYSGSANWDEIGKAVAIAKKFKTKIFGNGDINNIEDAKMKIKNYGVDGVLIGRAAFGNPWIFGDHIASAKEKLEILYQHCLLFNKYYPQGNFKSLRKHFIWYVKSLHNSSRLKNQLMTVNNIKDVKNILNDYSSFNE